MTSRLCRPRILLQITRLYGNKPKLNIEMEESLTENIINKKIRIRAHPGVMNIKYVSVPTKIVKAIELMLSEQPVMQILQDSDEMANYLSSRQPPIEAGEAKRKITEISRRLEESALPIQETMSPQEKDETELKRKITAKRIYYRTTYNWAPITYDRHQCFQYLLARAAPEYASLCRIFDEIKKREPDFKPDSFFDFGSGVGTGLWAAREYWGENIHEYFTVDISSTMNDIAKLILCGGNENKQVPIKSFFQRQFLPASSSITYDLVLSAYSLMELPSAKSRLETVATLWRKTTKYLVLVEHGTKSGFNLVNEARDYILQLTDGSEGHVFAPCPGDFPCPKLAKSIQCDFGISYLKLPIARRHVPDRVSFSYVVLKKGKRDGNNAEWPRVVAPTLIRKKHTICKLCMSNGQLEDVIFTKSKYGKATYWCARSSSWGDRLPVNISTVNDKTEITDGDSDESKTPGESNDSEK